MKKFLSVILVLVMEINFLTVEPAASSAEEKTGSSSVLGNVISVYDPGASASIQKRAASARLREMDESIGEVLNAQMQNYLSGSGADAAEIITISELSEYVSSIGGSIGDLEEYEKIGLKTAVSFPLNNFQYSYDLENDSKILQYLFQAIGIYPNLSPLYTQIICFYNDAGAGGFSISQLCVFSPLEENEFAGKIAAYKEVLKQLEKVPSTDNTMTKAEKLLYIHDKVVTMGEYAPNGRIDLAINHTPLGIALNGEGVCQSYAAIMNQAASDLGISSLQVCSDVHAWNAVQIKDKWYYIDTTYDDPVFQNASQKPENYVNHKYFLFHSNSYSDDASHEMNAENIEYYGYILDAMGNEYEDYFPKKNKITTQMNYENGVWVYMQNETQQTWEGEAPVPEDEPTPAPTKTPTPTASASPTPETPTATPASPSPATPTATPVSPSSVMPTATPASPTLETPTVVPTNTPAVNSSVAAPGRVVIQSLKNKKPKTIQCKLKKVKKAAGYQIRYATNKKFKKSKVKTSKSVTINLKKLKKKKTYYIKARAYRMVNGTKKYGKWSSVKKCKVRK